MRGLSPKEAGCDECPRDYSGMVGGNGGWNAVDGYMKPTLYGLCVSNLDTNNFSVLTFHIPSSRCLDLLYITWLDPTLVTEHNIPLSNWNLHQVQDIELV